MTVWGTRTDLPDAGPRAPPTEACRRALTSNGTLVLSSGESDGRWIGAVDRIIAGVVSSLFVSQRLSVLDTKQSTEDMRCLKELIEAGQVTPVIDRTCSPNCRAQQGGLATYPMSLPTFQRTSDCCAQCVRFSGTTSCWPACSRE